MLCTFAQLSDLENCRSLQSKGSSGGENAVVFKAQKVNDGEVSAFYAVVITSPDNGSADTALHAHFPAVDSATVQDAYKAQSSWGACFDALSDLQGAMESQRLMLSNAGFLLDSHCWPALTTSADPKSLRSADWVISDIQSLSTALAQLGLQGGHTPESPLGSWEVLQHTASIDANTATAAPASTASTAAPSNGARGTVRSYRNALLTAPAPSARSPEAEQSRKKLATAATAEWRRPAIVVQNLKYEHKDRLYQHNLVEKGIDPNAMYEQEDEDDGGGGGSFFQSTEYAKGSVSLNRTRAATLLRPAALERKMARIASKESQRVAQGLPPQRPPAPGSAAAANNDDSD